MRKRYVVFGLTAVLAISLAVPALGGPSNPIATVAASAKKTAKKTAKKALKKAKKANQAAQNAQATADGAASDASDAQQSANQAQNTADGAQTTADGAAAAAAAAQTSADAAQSTANSKYGDVTYRNGAASATNSTSPKLTAAACSSGEEPIAGGWTVSGAGLNDVVVYNNSVYLNGWLTQADEIGGGTADTWAINTRVVCIDQT